MNYIPFLFFTDPHATNRWPESRTDDFLKAILTKIAWLVQLANKLDAHILVGGDWVNKYNSRPEVINLLMSILRLANNDIFGIIGNHDIYGHNYSVINNVTVGSLFASGLVTLLDTNRPIIMKRDDIKVQLTGTNYRPNIDRDKSVYSVSKSIDADQAIHITHSFLLSKPWPNVSRDVFTCIDEVTTGVDVMCIGHDHRGFGIIEKEGTLFTNPGALGRVNADLVELKRMPKATLIKVFKDHCEASLIDVPARQGDEVLSREKIVEERERKKALVAFRGTLDLDLDNVSCNIDELMDMHAKAANIPEPVFEVSKKAITLYEATLINTKPDKEV